MAHWDNIKAKAQEVWQGLSARPQVRVQMGTCSIAAGADKTLEALRAAVAERKLDVEVGITGCSGLCHLEPLVEVSLPGKPPVLYGKVSAGLASSLVETALVKGQVLTDLAIGVNGGAPQDGIPALSTLEFMQGQERRLMARCGVIDPENIDHYLANNGYEALQKALAMEPNAVIEEVTNSGLTGRGGAAFSTGRKWSFLATAQGSPKYMLCNADEGDPGSFVNRILLEGDPHLVIEGIIIGCYATGAEKGFVYIREEYPLAARRMRRAVAQARERGLLGENILGTAFSCDIEVVRGAGSYVCGEETGLIDSIEGNRGMPRLRPPFPAQAGLWAKPSNVNNVESYANAPLIIRHGAEWWGSVGSERAKGTKMFSLSGHVQRVGVVEVPLGIPLRRIVEDMGGGALPGHHIKAIQPGGPLGGIMPASLLDTPLEPQAFAPHGVLMGSGGIVVLDERTCMIDLSRYFLVFAADESCARCTTCRIGTMRLTDILGRMCAGQASKSDLDRIPRINALLNFSNCAHGKSGATAATSALRHFESEFLAHIVDKQCPAGFCEGLTEEEPSAWFQRILH